MKRRAKAAAGAATLGAATAVAALVAGTTVGFAETSTSSAFGLEATGLVKIDPIPYVESTDGSTQTASLVEVPNNSLVEAGVVNVKAGDDKASTTLADVSVLPVGELPGDLSKLQGALKQVRDAIKICGTSNPPAVAQPRDLPLPKNNPVSDLLTKVVDTINPSKLCDALAGKTSLLDVTLLKVYCDGDNGGVKVGKVTVLGQRVDLPEVPANIGLPENNLLNLTLNKQEKKDDGSFSVTGIHVDLLDGSQVINVGNATCGGANGDDGDNGDDNGNGDNGDNTPTATKPAPVTTGLPVTG